MRSFITPLAVVALCGALSATDAPLAPLATAQAKQDGDKQSGKGRGSDHGKGRGHDGRHDGEHGRGGSAGSHAEHRHERGHDDADHDHAHGHHDDGDDGRHHHRRRWSGEWEVDRFVAAQFNLIALHQLLGGDLAPLHVGVQPLPPGIRKRIARGKPLPPGIAKKLPPPRLLPVLPHVVGHEWQVVGRDLLLIQLGTLIVAEIIQDALD